jgi:hypothetical protein
MRRHVLFAAIVLSALGASAQAATTLIPTPYPQSLGRNSMEQPVLVPRYHHHGELLEDPAPAAKGPNALGNPRIYRHSHHVRVPYPRQWWPRGYAD